ncbi:MAG: spondin domain-containing protein [Chloroflexota bacterium]
MQKKTKVVAFFILIVVGLFVTASISQASNTRTFKVTVTNLTDGQPLTPPLLATHSRQIGMFDVGQAANVGIQEIAENGNLGPMIDALSGSSQVHQYLVGDAPLVPASDPGGTGFPSTATYYIDAAPGQNGLSWASMLICTNDGFTGLDTVRLPKRLGAEVTYYTYGYDAGTEINTEDFADIVPPCQGIIGIGSDDAGTGASNPDLAEGGIIVHHPGVAGGNDLVPGVHGWEGPVASITVERVD